MQEYSLHILVVVMVVIVVSIAVTVPMVGVAKGCEADNIDQESKDADYQEFIETMYLMPLP
jgi:hypothetical protein